VRRRRGRGEERKGETVTKGCWQRGMHSNNTASADKHTIITVVTIAINNGSEIAITTAVR
jgi:hypothetical protein